jgi:ketosteroid isomerase-like protein
MNRIRIVTPLLMGVALMLGACEQAQEAGDMEETTADSTMAATAEAQLDSLRMNYEKAWSARDVNTLVGMMTPEYQEIGPDGVIGYEQASAMASDSANMAPEGARMSIEPNEMKVAESGDVAYGAGTTTVTIPGADGQEMTQRSHWVAGFKMVGGQWKIDRLAIVPETPAAAPNGAAADDNESM